MPKHLVGGIIGCKDKTSSWHLTGFPNGSKIGSTVSCRGENHRYTVHLLQSPCRDTKQNKDKDTMSLDYSSVCNVGSRVVWVSKKDCFCLKKNLNASGPTKHPSVRGENVKTFRWDHRLQKQNLFMAFKQVPR